MRLTTVRNSVLIGAVMLICFAAGSYATDGVREIKAFLREDFKIVLDGRTIILENSALIYNDSSYLPLRELGYILHVDVDWNKEERTVILTSPPTPPAVTPVPAATPTPVPVPVQDSSTSTIKAQYPAEIKFTNVIKYKITIDNRSYYLLANEQDSTMYFRKTDVEKMNLDLSGLQTVKEKYTSELYYPANELSSRLKNPGKWEITKEVIAHETNAEKLKALKVYLPSSSSSVEAFYIKEISANDDYEMLFRGADLRYYVYIMKLAANSNGTYYIRSTSIKYIYD